MTDRQGAKISTRQRFDSSRSNGSNKSTPDFKKVLLTSLPDNQMAKVLNKLQLTAMPGFSADDCIKLLWCSKVFVGHFRGYCNSGIFAQFLNNFFGL